MQRFFEHSGRIRAIRALGVTVLATVAVCGASSNDKSLVVPIKEAKFGPTREYGTSKMLSAAALWSDEASGRSTALVKFTKGSTPKHYHVNFDMQVVVLKGILVHAVEAIPESRERQLGPSSFWYQPRGEVHQNSCLVDECMIFVTHFGETPQKTIDVPDVPREN